MPICFFQTNDPTNFLIGGSNNLPSLFKILSLNHQIPLKSSNPLRSKLNLEQSWCFLQSPLPGFHRPRSWSLGREGSTEIRKSHVWIFETKLVVSDSASHGSGFSFEFNGSFEDCVLCGYCSEFLVQVHILKGERVV